jgi:hypothetical protein
MTFDEARAYIINRLIYIENRIDDLIIREIQPRKDRSNFFSEVLLNSAIIPTSGKFKLIRHLIKLNNWPSTDAANFHRLLNIRNQFAHASGSKLHVTGNIEKTDAGEQILKAEVYIYLESLDGNGAMQKVEYRDALKEFNKRYAEVRQLLHSILDLKEIQG